MVFSGWLSGLLQCVDFAAKFVGVRSPLPYKWRNVGSKHLKYGMNFAYGSTGVFNTLVTDPNMTVQIDLFQHLIKQSVYNQTDLQSSVALVTVAGNDYSAYIVKNGSAQVTSNPPYTSTYINLYYHNIFQIYTCCVRHIFAYLIYSHQ